jgi:hypothetical protein
MALYTTASEKALMTVFGGHGDGGRAGSLQRRLEAVLTPAELADSQVGACHRSPAGEPQDVEWAAASSRLHVLQSRPVVAVAEVPARHASASGTGSRRLARHGRPARAGLRPVDARQRR